MNQMDATIDARRAGRQGIRRRWHGGRVLSTPVRLISWLIPGKRIDTRPIARLERVLAVGRAFLTVSGLAAIYLDPTQPARLAAVTYAVLAAYAVYSVIVLVYVHRTARVSVAHGHVLHGFDMLWTAALTFVSEGPVSPFFLFFLFVVLSAAYRWGFVGTIVTTCVTVAVFLVQTLVAAAGPWRQTWLTSIDFELNETILRVAYLLLTGFLLGYLAEQEKQSRAELGAIADLTRQPRVDLGLGGSVVAVARALLRTFDAARVHFVLQDYETRQASLWRLDRSSSGGAADPPRVELSGDDQRTWLFADPGRAWCAGERAGRQLAARVVEPGAWPLRHVSIDLPAPFAEDLSFTRIVVANFGMQDQWRGRVYLVDPSPTAHTDQSVHFLDALADYITPALTNVFLLGRLRARATAEERARVARELHDGAIQALLGIEMKVEALRRGQVSSLDINADLEDIQQLLRREVLALRELMQALRPIPLDTGDQLPDVLASIVERFRRDTGLPARFVFTGGVVALPPATALEVVRIVQEALVNVRKHSRARNVLVRLTGGEHGCALVIEDDGTGFDFEGRLTREELDQRRLGPSIIKERARIAGAQLVVDSSRGSGTRIELMLPSLSHV
jgi:signal transduction histidine kinase